MQTAPLHFLWLEITGRCNLECVHCYSDSSPRVATRISAVDDWGRVLADGSAAGCRAVQFIGGEPTLHPALPDLIQRARALGYSFVEVYTNGSAFTGVLKAAFASHRVALAFSVYSHEPEVHDAVTLRPRSHGKTIASIQWALENNLPVRVSIIDVGMNHDAIAETAGWLSALGVSSVAVDRERGVGRAIERHVAASQLDELCGHCWEGKLCVGSQGMIYPCVFSRGYPVGTMAEGLPAVLEGEPLKAFRESYRDRVTSASNRCVPQCGPDCSPATCPPHTCRPTTCSPAASTAERIA